MVALADVTCLLPSPDGMTIGLEGTASATGVFLHFVVGPAKVTVVAASGAGTAYAARTFSGSGVQRFDPAVGTQVSSTLTEQPSGATPPGNIGLITSVVMSVACNNQQPGSSTVMLSGNTAVGPFDGGINPVRVVCQPNSSALTLGSITIGTTTELVELFGGTTQSGTPAVSLQVIPSQGSQQHFTAQGPGVSRVTASGAEFNADAVEDDGSQGSAAVVVHVSGAVTCGSSTVPA